MNFKAAHLWSFFPVRSGQSGGVFIPYASDEGAAGEMPLCLQLGLHIARFALNLFGSRVLQ